MEALRGLTAIAWAAFDPQWYLDAYPGVRDAAEETSPDALLYFYLQHGRRIGHSPNILFDEGWYLETYADAALAVRRGEAASGFDHYCRTGFGDRSPHWLFDETLYRHNYPQMTDEALQAAGLVNGYDHYVRHGSREGRIGHWLFDPAVYRAQLDPEAAQDADAVGPFRHYLARIVGDGREPATSLYFDPAWYRNRYPGIFDDVAAGRWHGTMHHYLRNDTPTEFDPLQEFSEAFYLADNPEVADAVGAGEFRNGYAHFLAVGRLMLASPNAEIDLRYYTRLPRVRADLRRKQAPDGFTHYLQTGKALGLPPALPADERVTRQQAQLLFRRKAEHLLPLFARANLSFACESEPEISAVVRLGREPAPTLVTLGSLRSNYAGAIELILVDEGGATGLNQIERFVEGAWLLRVERQLGSAGCRNAGLYSAAAEAVLFLDASVELAPGAIATALRRLNSDAAIGAVGGRIIAADGTLHEGGGMIRSDGSAVPYAMGASPDSPEANFVRVVDYCSSFLLVRATVLRTLDGFDQDFATPRYADADFGARVAAGGYRVVYDPAVTLHDYAPELADDGVEIDRRRFAVKHTEWLAGRAGDKSRSDLFTRSPVRRRRLLFIESMIPVRSLGSGFVRSNDILHAVSALGWDVSLFPLRDSELDLATLYRDLPDSVEIMHDRAIGDLSAFLADRAGYYDAIWVARTHNFDDIADLIDRARGAGGQTRVILDTEAIAAARKAERAALVNPDATFDVAAVLAREFVNIQRCQTILAVNAEEAGHLRALGHRDIRIVGHACTVRPTPRPFAERDGLLFVGAIREQDSPNYDALCWFIDAVLPRIEAALGWEARLTVAGDLGEDASLDRFRHHQRVTLCGTVAALEPLYATHRLFIAPTRYAAGLPYKLHEAASYGLPVVATDLLARQTGWRDGVELVSVDRNDPDAFADAVVALYRDGERWQALREAAFERLRDENSAERFVGAVRAVLEEGRRGNLNLVDAEVRW